MYLPDINVWLALTFEVHAFHTKAKSWFDEATVQSCAFCRLTQLGFLRLATNPAVFKEEVLTLDRAWSCYDQLLGDERVFYLHEPAGLENIWRAFASSSAYSPKIWNDAFLAAFALQSKLQLVTFDQGFKAYENLAVIVLS